MRGAKREVTAREQEQLARWLRSAATSGDGMPTIAQIMQRFSCGWHLAREMLEQQRAAGTITFRKGSGGLRPLALPTPPSSSGASS